MGILKGEGWSEHKVTLGLGPELFIDITKAADGWVPGKGPT